MNQPESALYVYALTPSEATLDLAGVAGIGDARVHVLPHGAVTAIVSSVRTTDLDAVDENDLSESGVLATLARRHDAVIQAVFAQSTVLPLRFGTVVRDREAAVRVADSCRAEAVGLFARLHGRREWGVRLVVPERPEPGPGEAEDDRARHRAETSSGTAYLHQRRAALREREARREHEARSAERLETGLAAYAAETVRRRGSSSPLLLDLACLVDRDRENDFLDEVDRQAGDVTAEGLVVETTGPWPPYTFARLELSASPA